MSFSNKAALAALMAASGYVLLLVASPALVAAEELYQWPLDLSRELSSSFGEYRTGRFHAGIDLRTGGVIGRPVYAAADGYVSRVRCSPYGYGKAVYIQFNDGNSVVYAHLDDYSDEVRAYVRQNQHARQTYTVDLYPQPGQFPVRRGEQVALSGRTGVGPPHLHYELRDSANRPFNPRLAGIKWPDTTRPVIRVALVTPYGPVGTVNGGFTPETLEVVHQGGGRYTASPVAISGRVGIGVDVMDPGNDGLRFGVHILRLLHEGRELFRVQHDHLSYDTMHNGAVAYHPFFLDKGRFLLLWRWPGNASPPYSHSPSSGWFDVPDAPGELVAEAVDFMGNSATLTIPFRPEKPQEGAVAAASTADAPGAVAMACHGEWLVLTAAFPSAEGHAPELLAESGATITLTRFLPKTERTWEAAFRPEQSGIHSLRVHHPRIAPFEETVHVVLRGSAEQTLALQDVRLGVKRDSPYGVLFAQARPAQNTSAPPVRLLGTPWRIWPENTPVDAQIDLSLPMPEGAENPARLRLYRDTGNGWRYVGGRRRGDRLEASVRNFGVYAVLEDTQPPTIRDVSPPDGYHAQTRRPIIRATIADVGSGIAEFTITANGKWLLAEYDPDENRLEWERDQELPSGEQELIYRVADNAGNVTTVRRTVQIP